jgi:hypothetical protein
VNSNSGPEFPDSPVNVRLLYADGVEVPVDCVYRGEQDGTHIWEVVNGRPSEKPKRVLVEKIPALTTIILSGRDSC